MPKTLKIIPGFIMATLGLFAGVGPNEAASHLAEWAAFFGVENVPVWLVGRTADRLGMVIGFIGFIAWGFWYFDVYKTMHSKKEEAHLFERLLHDGNELISEGGNPHDPRAWKSRVVLWDVDVKRLLGSSVPAGELAAYKHMGPDPDHSQDVSAVLTTLKNRHNKLRLIYARYTES